MDVKTARQQTDLLISHRFLAHTARVYSGPPHPDLLHFHFNYDYYSLCGRNACLPLKSITIAWSCAAAS